MSQSLKVDMEGIGVGPMGSAHESSTSLPIEMSRFLMRPVVVFISSIFTRRFLVVKLVNLSKGLDNTAFPLF